MLLQHLRTLITGASRGIGASIAEGLAAAGAEVVLNCLPAETEAAEHVASQIRSTGGAATVINADVSKIDEVQLLVHRMVDQCGGVDVLVNNAGICPWCDFLDLSPALWTQTQAVNQFGVFLCSQAVARQMMLQTNGGSIIMISSVGAKTGNQYQVHYNASKAAVSIVMY